MIEIDCPVCCDKATLDAQAKPDGIIGCFCRKCNKIYLTKDPENGWEESSIELKSEQDEFQEHRDLFAEVVMIRLLQGFNRQNGE